MFRAVPRNSLFASKEALLDKNSCLPPGPLDCWDQGISGSAPKIQVLIAHWTFGWWPEWISSCCGRKEKQSKDENLIYKHEVRTGSVTSCPFFPLAPHTPGICDFTDISGWSSYKGRWIFIVRRTLPGEILHFVLLCLFTTGVERPLRALKVTLVPF